MLRDIIVLAPGMYDVDELSKATGLECLDESLTVQSDAIDADINTIVKRFGLTGQLPQGLRVPQYEDFGDAVFDYRSALDAVKAAEDAFMELPADVRARFGNDPQSFMEFCTAEENGKLRNLEEMRKLGLAIPARKEENADTVVKES